MTAAPPSESTDGVRDFSQVPYGTNDDASTTAESAEAQNERIRVVAAWSGDGPCGSTTVADDDDTTKPTVDDETTANDDGAAAGEQTRSYDEDDSFGKMFDDLFVTIFLMYIDIFPNKKVKSEKRDEGPNELYHDGPAECGSSFVQDEGIVATTATDVVVYNGHVDALPTDQASAKKKKSRVKRCWSYIRRAFCCTRLPRATEN